ncbi:hypothetical protein SOPP22_14805 [Shewanella sp. OPT22]|nr:hypothetical protein SOPP22_14805 [Shewanella sp. OPT22]
MKKFGLALLAGLMTANLAVASQLTSPIQNVEVSSIDSNKLSIQNHSSETVKIDIYGKELSLSPSSGVSFHCEGYSYLELLLTDLIHDYFEVQCGSQVIINESFKLENTEA